MEFPMYPADDARREQEAEDTRHLWAVRVLDAWAKRNDESAQAAPVFHRYMGVKGMWTIYVTVSGRLITGRYQTAACARVDAAKQLVADDPTLEEEI